MRSLSSPWTVGVLECAPRVLPMWVERTGPHLVPVLRTALRPAPHGLASIRCAEGSAVLLDSSASPALDLELLEQAIVREEPFSSSRWPRWYPGFVSPVVRRRIARAEHILQRRLGRPVPALTCPGADAVRALRDHALGRRSATTWPEDAPSAFVVTHDVEQARANDVLALARAEARLGVRATYFLVPSEWAGRGLVPALLELGHEVGCHGVDHSGQEAFASPEQLQAAAGRLGLEPPIGYRSPRFVCPPGHGRRLRPVFSYDSSRPDVRQGRPRMRWSGCGSLFPFLEDGGLLQLPVTFPTDLDLLDEGYSWPSALLYWRAKWRLVQEAGGLGMLGTHLPAPGGWQPALRFVEDVRAEGKAWIGTAGSLAAFLRLKEEKPGALRPWMRTEPRPRRPPPVMVH